MAAPAARTAPAVPDAGEDAGRTGDVHSRSAVPDIADDLADMLRRGRVGGGTGVASVEFRMMDGRRVYMDLPAPMTTATGREVGDDTPDSPADAVLAYLSCLRPGEWAKGRTIAAEIDMEYDGGHFKKLLAGMVQDDLLESSKTNGYRLKRHNETP